MIGYSDADQATDPDNRRSTSGYCVYLGGNLVSWSSKKQQTMSKPSTELEYRSFAQVTVEIIWILNLLGELGIKQTRPPLVWCDNLSTIYLSANPVLIHAQNKWSQIFIL